MPLTTAVCRPFSAGVSGAANAVRFDLRCKLLTLFSDLGLRAARDSLLQEQMMALLPAIAAACEGLELQVKTRRGERERRGGGGFDLLLLRHYLAVSVLPRLVAYNLQSNLGVLLYSFYWSSSSRQACCLFLTDCPIILNRIMDEIP